MSVIAPLPPSDLEFIVRSCDGLWEELRSRRILITGATGFFGRWLLESLLHADDQLNLGVNIVALSRDPENFVLRAQHLADSERLKWVLGSVRTLEPSSLGNKKIDLVIHLATEADTSSTLRDPLSAIDVITGGTRHTLEIARAAGAQRFLFTSSGSSYGPLAIANGPVHETYVGGADVTNMDAVYAISGEAKRHAELLCAATTRQYGMATVIARCFAFSGPGLPVDGKFAFGNFLRDALAGRPITITGDGTPVRSYLYAADLAVWLWTLLFHGEPGRAYNVGSDEPVNLSTLANLIGSEFGDREVVIKQTPTASATPHYYVPSIERVKTELGLNVTVSMRESIQRTAAWLGSNVPEAN